MTGALTKFKEEQYKQKIKHVCNVISGFRFSYSFKTSFSQKLDLILGGLSLNEALRALLQLGGGG